jgi:hypothetical protein
VKELLRSSRRRPALLISTSMRPYCFYINATVEEIEVSDMTSIVTLEREWEASSARRREMASVPSDWVKDPITTW